jgi:SAM-dependent methyltransferase
MTDHSSMDLRVTALRERFGLDYHASYVLNADLIVGFAGKRVLEVGGSLPEELVIDDLGAHSWLGVEETSYYDDAGGLPAKLIGISDISALRQPLPRYSIASGKVEGLPADLYGGFDVVFSIAAFEHILDLPAALTRMHEALVPGGRLVAMFSPIWSAHDGHHLHGVTDARGRCFTFADSGIPPWGHLLMSPHELQCHMLKLTDPVAADEIVHQVYGAPCINRRFTEDYVEAFRSSPFSIQRLEATFPRPVPVEVQARLEARYPGRKHFANNGLLVVLEKAIASALAGRAHPRP